ncbi:MAG: hypothetical protein LBP79_01630 [Clostridiales bacterium]|jgi:hypothetical protein|nr:hypothetical protein [Clostridiales bacterium]
MVMMRFYVSKLNKRSNGTIVTDATGGVVCVAYETPYGYVLNDKDRKSVIGTLNFNKRTAVIGVPEDNVLTVKRKFFGGVKFNKESGYYKKGSMRKFKVDIFENGRLSARISRNPDDAGSYALDIRKSANALRTMLIALALNDFFLRKKS